MVRGQPYATAGRNGKNGNAMPPFPTRQMFVLACCRICEPIAFMSIFPYIYYMIQDFHVTDDPSKISVYAGMVTSAFTLAEFATGVLWGKLSDKIGRKPVLLLGLLGTALSVLVFGFAPNLPVALFARALGGLLNGNIGVLQTTVAELVTVKEQQPRAYTIMPMVWCIGSIIGPMIGVPLCGRLGRPAEKKSLLVDNGVMGYNTTSTGSSGLSEADEPLPVYQSRESSPNLGPQSDTNPEATSDSGRGELENRPLVIFTKPVIMNIMSYGILAFHTMTFDQLFPVFLSTEPPINGPTVELPFKFVNGFGLDTKTIGVIMSVQGIYSLFSNYMIVAPVTTRLGSLRLFRMLAFSYFALYLVTPYLVLLPQNLRMPAIYILVIWKCTYATMAYPNNAILLANSAPTKEVLGTINGIAASTASLCRALGPTVSGFLYAAGLHTGYSGLAWWFSGVVTLVGAYLSSQISENGSQATGVGNDDPLLDERLLDDYDDNDVV
ncbi:hypothetical protein H634G_04492 [Metarhizium anisopliae BRIP 53293]|uniref:Major facilitator superfamily (MFS) profile domain-containing protein n=1 Tax=Metarhizium anisopliae BRIP 53293 TaxID=1291518 RepID=A0A0D9P2B9_METAN|nr:hypothetical protein H634G_04492 [Metarhizium anisopliae BRIP 53293]